MVVRRFAGALVLLGVAACGRAVPEARGPVGPPAPVAATPSPAAEPRALPAATRQRPALSPTEPAPAAKRVAASVATTLTTYAPTDTAEGVAARVTRTAARRAALVAAAAPLWHAGRRSTGTVVYPQLGGLTATQASVMVVVTQRVTGLTTETRVLDVRLVRTARGWAFDALASAGGTPVARPSSLPEAARAVLDDPRIVLPDSARWDIHRGAVSPELLRVMAALAARTPYAVTVLETGHPHDVFGTSHTSAHTVGHAVDVHALAGVALADLQATGSAAWTQTRWLLGRTDVRQVGSPWDLDGASRRSFTNTVHLDHLHIAV